MNPSRHTINAAVTSHWSRCDAADWIEAKLAERGIDAPDWRDVARLDQLHAGGLKAVESLAARLPVAAGQSVIDVGGGLGAAARYLAAEHHCQVICADLTPSLVHGGARLTRITGLQPRVSHLVADAAALPCRVDSLDGAWVQHLAMQVPDAAALWREAGRVLHPGGWLAIHEWVSGDGGAPRYPTPWAPADGSLSYPVDAQALTDTLSAAGFSHIELDDVSEAMAAGYARQLTAVRESGRLDNPVIPPEELLASLENALRNLRERRLLCLSGWAVKG